MIEVKVFLRQDDDTTAVEYFEGSKSIAYVELSGQHPDLQEVAPDDLAYLLKEYEPQINEESPQGCLTDLVLKLPYKDTLAIREGFHRRRVNELDQELEEMGLQYQRLEVKRNRHLEKMEKLNREKI